MLLGICYNIKSVEMTSLGSIIASEVLFILELEIPSQFCL